MCKIFLCLVRSKKKQIFELCLPICFVGILVAIKGAVEDTDGFAPEEVPAFFPSNNDALKIFSFTDYVTALQAKRTCTAGNAPPLSFPGGMGGRKLEETVPCQDYLASSPICVFAQICDCEALVSMSTGCGSVYTSDMGEISIDEVCPLYCGACSEGEAVGPPPSMSDQAPPGFDFGDLLGNGLGISGIYRSGWNWQVPFVKCDGRLCEEEGQDARGLCEYLALGVAPSTPDDVEGLRQAEAFRDYIYRRYPILSDNAAMPFDFDFIQMMESNAMVEKYVKAEEYGGDLPKLGLAVVFDGKSDPTINYNYAIRHNATGFNSPELEGRPTTLTGPPTDKMFELYAREDNESCPEQQGGTPEVGPYSESCTGRYIYNGFLTIQRLVHDFIIEDSGAAAEGYSVSDGGVSFAPFPSLGYIETGK